MTDVRLPDGTIARFPDDMSQEDIERVLQQQFSGETPSASGAQYERLSLPARVGRGVVNRIEPLARGAASSVGLGVPADVAGRAVGERLVQGVQLARGERPIEASTIDELVAQSRARGAELRKEFPLTSIAGTIGGGTAALSRLPALAGRPLSRAALGGAIGAGEAGAFTASEISPEEAPGAALRAAPLGAAGAAVAPAVGAVAGFLGRRLDEIAAPARRALRRISEVTGESAESLFKKAQDIEEKTGQVPRIAEIASRSGAKNLGGEVSKSPEAVATMQDAFDKAGEQLQKTLTSLVRRKGNALTESQVERVRDISTTKAIAPIRNEPVVLSNADQAKLSAALAKIPVSNELRSVVTSDASVGRFDALRRQLGKLVRKAERDIEPLEFERYSNARDLVESLVGDQYPAYSAAIRRYHELSQRARDVATGASGVASPSAFASGLSSGAPEDAAAGFRGGLVTKAGSGPSGARALSEDLSNNVNFKKRIAAALGAKESKRLEEAGRALSESSERLAAASGGSLRAEPSAAGEISDLVARVVFIPTQGGGAAKAGLAESLIGFLTQRKNIDKRIANEIANVISDPERTHLAIVRMRQLGLTGTEIGQAYGAALSGASAALLAQRESAVDRAIAAGSGPEFDAANKEIADINRALSQ